MPAVPPSVPQPAARPAAGLGVKSPLDRFLSLFTDVRAGEGGQLLLLGFTVFLILTSYYVMKPVREALILAQPGGAEIKSYAMAWQAALLVAVVPLYGALAKRLPRRRLINVVTLFYVACLPVFYVLAERGVRVGVPFFLWIGIFSLMVIAQFWAFCNDLYTVESGKRLFALIAFGASSGAVFGAFVSHQLIDVLGVRLLLLVAGGILALSLLCFNVVDAYSRRHPVDAPTAAGEEDQPVGDRSPFAVVWSNRYLLGVALLILMLNWVNATGEYIMGRIVSREAAALVAAGEQADAGAYIGSFYAGFFQVVNLAGMLLQLFIVSRLIRFLGVPVAICVLPVVAFGSYAVAAALPVLAVVRWVKTAENSVDYSLQNTVSHTLYLPTTREEKYKAKQLIDTFFVRIGDVLSAATVYAGTHWLTLGVSQFAQINMALVVVWLALAVWVGRRFRRADPKTHPPGQVAAAAAA